MSTTGRTSAETRADADAAVAIARGDPALPALAVLLDPDRLTEVLGQPIRVTRLRYKPAAVVVVAFESAGEHRWVASYADGAKIEKTLWRARRLGGPVSVVPGLGDATITGGAYADRALAQTIQRLHRAEHRLLSRARIVRHNPHRRLVLAVKGHAIKVVSDDTAPSTARADAVQRMLAERGIPALAPTPMLPGVSWTRWWGDGDLRGIGSEAAASAAGLALARLHAVEGLPAPRASTDELGSAAEAIAVIAPDLAERARRVARLAAHQASRAVLVHGDFSADQVLVDDATSEAGIRLIDFDRVCIDEPEGDLGSFLAAECGETAVGDALLDAYRRAGGVINAEVLTVRVAGATLQRAVEPFRTATPGWYAATEAAVARAEAMLS